MPASKAAQICPFRSSTLSTLGCVSAREGLLDSAIPSTFLGQMCKTGVTYILMTFNYIISPYAMTFNAPTWSGTKHPMILHRLGRPKNVPLAGSQYSSSSEAVSLPKNQCMGAKLSASQILLLPPWIKMQPPSGMVWKKWKHQTRGCPRSQIWRRYYIIVIRVCKPWTSQWVASPRQDQIRIIHIDCRTWIDLVRHNAMSSCSGFSQIQWSHRSTGPVQLTLQWVHHLAHDETMRARQKLD